MPKRIALVMIALLLIACRLPGMLVESTSPARTLTPTLSIEVPPPVQAPPILAPPTLAPSSYTLAVTDTPAIHGAGRKVPSSGAAAPGVTALPTPGPTQQGPAPQVTAQPTPPSKPPAVLNAPVPWMTEMAQSVSTLASMDMPFQLITPTPGGVTTATPGSAITPAGPGTPAASGGPDPFNPAVVYQHARAFATAYAGTICTYCDSVIYVCKNYGVGKTSCRFQCIPIDNPEARGLEGVSFDVLCTPTP